MLTEGVAGQGLGGYGVSPAAQRGRPTAGRARSSHAQDRRAGHREGAFEEALRGQGVFTAEEAAEMSEAISPSTGKRYGVARICARGSCTSSDRWRRERPLGYHCASTTAASTSRTILRSRSGPGGWLPASPFLSSPRQAGWWRGSSAP